MLVFDGSSALCGSSPWTVEDFTEFDWVSVTRTLVGFSSSLLRRMRFDFF